MQRILHGCGRALIELIAAPMMFGGWRTAAAFSALNAVALSALTVDTSIVVSPSAKRRQSSTCRRAMPPRSGA